MTDQLARTALPVHARGRGAGAGLAHRFLYPLAALVRRDLRRRYASTMLGGAWAVLQPLIYLLLYVLVFSFILRLKIRPDSGPADFALFLLCGMLPYLALSDGIQRASTSLRENRGLLDQVDFPAEVVPAAPVITAAIAEAIGLGLVSVLALVSGESLSPWLLFLPVLVALRIVLTFGCAWFISVLAVFLPDVGEMLALGLMACLFLTPIFYTPDAVPGSLAWLTPLNPLHHIVSAYRAVLLDGRPPFPLAFAVAAWALTFGIGGLWFFRKTLERAKDFL